MQQTHHEFVVPLRCRTQKVTCLCRGWVLVRLHELILLQYFSMHNPCACTDPPSSMHKYKQKL